MNVKWTVNSTKADKQAVKLSEKVMLQLKLLFMDLTNSGPQLQTGRTMENYVGKKAISDTVICRKENLLMFVAGK